MESFYGGRQGISFIIKKSFNSIYATFDYMKCLCDNKGNLAIDSDNNLIEYDEVQHSQFNYKNIELNGEFPPHRQAVSFIDNVFGEEVIRDTSKINVPFVKNEENGMVNCFKEGGKTTNIVNYGEYVIIDTINKSNPDNGKVFRRGLDFNNELGGAEYIGQIVGPQGKAPEVFLDDIKKLEEMNGNFSSEILNFPGKYIENDEEKFNDEVKVAFVNFVDNINNETICKIGFQIPYHILEIEESINLLSYNQKPTIIRTDDNKHPFFHKWALNAVPGVPGDKIELFIDEEYAKAGTTYYSDKLCKNQIGTLTTDVPIAYKNYQEGDLPEVIGRPIIISTKSNTFVYVKKVESPKDKVIMIAKINTFNKNDKTTNGTFYYEILGEINIINEITLDTNTGKLLIDYTYKTDNETQLEWVKDVSMNEEGQVSIHKTTDKNTDGTIINEDNPIKWIKSITLSENNGHFVITYNTKDDQGKQQKIEANLTWVKDVSMNDQGQISIYKTTDENTEGTIINKDNPIKWIQEIMLSETDGHFVITYNTKDNNKEQQKVEANLTWVKDVSINNRGQISIYKTTDKNTEGTIINEDNPIQWIESTKIVDEASYLALVQKGFDSDTIPSIGSVIVKYNTNTTENNNLSQYFYLWNGEYQKVWTKIGEAQELTGLKIFKTEENGFDKIKDYATSIPAGWGVFIPTKKNSETGEYSKAYIVIKNGYGSGYNNPDSWPKIYIEDLGVGNSPELITPTNYATGVQNLEQELLFGKDTYIEEYLDNKGNKVTEINYCNETTMATIGAKYYKVKTTVYREDQMEPTIAVDENGVLRKIETGNYASFSNNKLSLVSSKYYQYIDNKLSMASENKMKTDILYLVTVGNPTIEEEILVKETIIQETPNGRKIIKEQNIIKSKGDN